MSKVKFKLNKRGVRTLLKSPEMQSVLVGYASSIKNRLGGGYEQDIHVGKNRANASVWAESFKAKKENSKTNSILKAVKS